jgi:predicted dinucleotide-binding enzyme
LKIAIIGKGNVGNALAKGLRGKHEIRFGHRDPKEPVLEAAKWGDVIILAVPHDAVEDAAKTIGSAASGKTLIDVTNALDENGELAFGFTTSAAEELQKMLPQAHVVKAFNTVFAKNQSVGRIDNEQLTAFIAGDDLKSKQIVMSLARDIGFDPIDSGALKVARFLEPMAMLMINLGFDMKLGTNIGFKLVKG